MLLHCYLLHCYLLHCHLLHCYLLLVTLLLVTLLLVTLLLVTLLLVTFLPVLLLQYYMSHPILIRGPQERSHRHQKQVSSMCRTKVTISLLEVGLLQPLHHFLDLQVDLRLMKMVPTDFQFPKTLAWHQNQVSSMFRTKVTTVSYTHLTLPTICSV